LRGIPRHGCGWRSHDRCACVGKAASNNGTHGSGIYGGIRNREQSGSAHHGESPAKRGSHR
jgi:hypothetical protein